MSNKKEIKTVLKTQFQDGIKQALPQVRELYNSCKKSLSHFDFILHCLETNQLKLKSKDEAANQLNDEADKTISTGLEKKQKAGKKKRTVPAATVTSNAQDLSPIKSESSNDSLSSNASTRGRRAAAQAADQKRAQGQSFIASKKLRRPTDFEKKKAPVLHSPPAESRNRNTYCKGRPNGSVDLEEEDSLPRKDFRIEDCSVQLERLSTPRIESLTNRSVKRKSEDLFSDNSSEETNGSSGKENELPSKMKKKVEKVKRETKKDTHTERLRGKTIRASDADSNEKGVREVKEPLASSSPISCSEPVVESPFKGFNLNDPECNSNLRNISKSIAPSMSVEGGKRVTRNTVATITSEYNDEIMQIVAEEERETRTSRSRSKVLKKEGNNKKEVNAANQTFVVDEKDVISVQCLDTENEHSSSPVPRSRTKILGKNTVDTKVELEDESSPVPIRTRTKTLKKHCDSQGSDEEIVSRSRTKTIRKEEEPVVVTETETRLTLKKHCDSQGSDEEIVSRSRTKTIRKEEEPVVVTKTETRLKEPLSANRLPTTDSPTTLKGKMVKKRVEDFEKKNLKVCEEVNTTSGRVTRNAAKKRDSSEHKDLRQQHVASILKRAKRLSQAKQALLLEGGVSGQKKLGSHVVGSASKVFPVLEKGRLTPLSVNNRMNPTLITNSLTMNRYMNSATRQEPAEEKISVVQKQLINQQEKKAMEEKRQKRQLKEVEAKKKKETALKTTAEESRRRREEKHLKVVAAKEAAEREKALLAAKAEQEKEEKLKIIAAEKEKQKEEMRKKKLLIQQKALENEERRKQEEAARIAKLKEQEEEQKRIMASREREQELLQKQQKAAELRLAEAEKAKQQLPKMMKVAPNIAKVKAQAISTPTSQPIQSYEITPAREDRSPLKPKTETDYGIDDANSDDSSEDEGRPKKKIPDWAQPKNRQKLVEQTNKVSAALWDEFWGCRPCMPDVTTLFAGIPMRKRIRTSSAVWRTPPSTS